jgi:hypothetical protein
MPPSQRHAHAQWGDEDVVPVFLLGVDLAEQLEGKAVVGVDELAFGDAQLTRQALDRGKGVAAAREYGGEREQ